MEEANFNVEHVPTNNVWEYWEDIDEYVTEAAEATCGSAVEVLPWPANQRPATAAAIQVRR